MLELITKEILEQIKRKRFPTRLIINYQDYLLLEQEVERKDLYTLFNLAITIHKITKFKLQYDDR